MSKPLDDFPEHEQRFLRKFFEFVNAFNKFDQNLTLALGWVVSGGAPYMAYPLVTKLTTHEKIDSLNKIFSSEHLKSKDNLLKDINGWATQALKVKCLRNDIVHAQWQILVKNDSHKFFHFRNSSPSNNSKSGEMSIDEFDEIVAAMEKVNAEFGHIHQKYLGPYTGGRVMPDNKLHT